MFGEGLGFALVLVWIFVFLLSISFHEFGHAYFAYSLGDDTAKLMGRLTLNPLSHIDPIGFLFFIYSGLFGWAKPVPVNPFRFKSVSPTLGYAIVSLGGPLFNIILAVVFSFLVRVLSFFSFSEDSIFSFLSEVFKVGVVSNIFLASFNLVPIPPLDGARILQGTILSSLESFWEAFERYGFLILIGLLLLEDVSNGSFKTVSIFVSVVSLPFFYLVRLISGVSL